MSSINNITLLGNVGSEPQVRHLDSGMCVANFSLATTKRYKDKEPKTFWHNIVVWGSLAEKVVAKYVNKGSQLCVIGELQYEEYPNKEGVKITKAVINVSQLTLLGGNKPSQPATTNEPANSDDLPF